MRRLRGHSALIGALDTTVYVSKSGTVRTAVVVKANDSEEGQRIAFTLESIVIGQDDDGETTAPVVIPADSNATAPKPTRRLTDRQRNALDALAEVSVTVGKPAPTNLQLPARTIVVPMTAWREELLSRQVIERDAKNPREDFKRVREQLQARRLIGIHDDLIWKA